MSLAPTRLEPERSKQFTVTLAPSMPRPVLASLMVPRSVLAHLGRVLHRLDSDRPSSPGHGRPPYFAGSMTPRTRFVAPWHWVWPRKGLQAPLDMSPRCQLFHDERTQSRLGGVAFLGWQEPHLFWYSVVVEHHPWGCFLLPASTHPWNSPPWNLNGN